LLHAGPTLAGRFFRSAAAAPMSFEARCELVALLLERSELSSPVDRASSHSGPFLFVARRLLLNVFSVNLADAILLQLAVAIGIGTLATHSSVPRIPVDHEIWGFHCREQTCSLRSSCSVACVFIFENQDDVLLCCFVCSFAHFVVNCGPIGSLIVQPPKIE